MIIFVLNEIQLENSNVPENSLKHLLSKKDETFPKDLSCLIRTDKKKGTLILFFMGYIHCNKCLRAQCSVKKTGFIIAL
jgi:hypothetical protein